MATVSFAPRPSDRPSSRLTRGKRQFIEGRRAEGQQARKKEARKKEGRKEGVSYKKEEWVGRAIWLKSQFGGRTRLDGRTLLRRDVGPTFQTSL